MRRIAVSLVLVPAVFALNGCGHATKPYTVQEVRDGFAKAGEPIDVLIGVPSDSLAASRLGIAMSILSDVVILGANGGTKNMSVFVYKDLRNAVLNESRYHAWAGQVAVVQDGKYRRQAKQIGIARKRNVLVLYRNTVPGLTLRVSAALANLHA